MECDQKAPSVKRPFLTKSAEITKAINQEQPDLTVLMSTLTEMALVGQLQQFAQFIIKNLSSINLTESQWEGVLAAAKLELLRDTKVIWPEYVFRTMEHWETKDIVQALYLHTKNPNRPDIEPMVIKAWHRCLDEGISEFPRHWTNEQLYENYLALNTRQQEVLCLAHRNMLPMSAMLERNNPASITKAELPAAIANKVVQTAKPLRKPVESIARTFSKFFKELRNTL